MSSYKLADRVRETATFASGSITLLGAPPSYQTFSAGLGADGRTLICATVGSNWLVAEADYNSTANTLSNLTVLAPADATTALLTGTLDVFVTAPAERLPVIDENGSISAQSLTLNETAQILSDADQTTIYAPGVLLLDTQGDPGLVVRASGASILTIEASGAATFANSVTASSFVGPITGNASTATKLATARTISLDGSMTGSASFDGSADTTITAWLVNQTGLTAGTYGNLTISAKGLVTAARAIAATDVTGLATVATTGAYADLTGKPTIPTTTSQLTNNSGFITANQSVTLTGDVTGSGGTSIAVTLAASGCIPGAYINPNTVQIDSKGRVTAVLSGPRIYSATTSGTYTCIWDNYDIIRLTVNAPLTVYMQGGVDGGRYTLEITQDSVGSRTVTVSGLTFGTDITSYSQTQTANKTDVLGIWKRGSAYRLVALAKGF